MQKNNYLKFGATLFIICLVASGLLSLVHSLTKDKIQDQKDNEEKMGLMDVLPKAKDFEFMDRGDNSFYVGTDAQGGIVGYAFVAEKRGYSSDIITMVGITGDGAIQGIKILSQNETPGLGSKIVEVKEDRTIWSVLSNKSESKVAPKPWFQEQFQGKNINDSYQIDAVTGATISSSAHVNSLMSQIETITGATISSTAVIDSIKERSEVILEEIKNAR